MTALRRVLAVAILATTFVACGGKGKTSETELLDSLAATDLASRTMDYRVTAGDSTVGVHVTVEDDYRYAADLLLGDHVAYREVVFDDALAAQLVNAAAATLLGQAPDATALAPGAWLVDEVGAPTGVSTQPSGNDPIIDVLGFFSYVRDAARATEVKKFDLNALDYRPDEDPFPKPAAGEKRFDVVPTPLPSRADIEKAIGSDVPSLSDLRKLAVYVRAGKVVAIREAVDVKPFAESLRRAFAASGASTDDLFKQVNKLRAGIGQTPLVAHSTTLLVTAGAEQLHVELPAGTATHLALHVGEVAITAP